MGCQQFSAMMSERLDDQLDGAEIAAMNEHLMTCACCQAEWDSMQALDALFAEAQEVPAPCHFQAAVMERIRRRERARRTITTGLMLALGAAAIGLLMLSPLLLWTLNTQSLLPVLIAGGPETVSLILSYMVSLGRIAVVLLEQFAVPLGLAATTCLMAALVLNCILFGALRRVHRRQ